MNSISIAGQLGKDSELRFLPNGDPVCSFSIADQQGKDKPTIWWNCSLFGKRAESLQQYLTKGQSVTVSGTISEREWTDKEGNKRKSIDVRVGDVALQGSRQSTQESDPPRASPKPAQTKQAARPAPDLSDFDEDIPF